MSSHRLQAQITLALGGQGVDDTDRLLVHGGVLSGNRSDSERATPDGVAGGRRNGWSRDGSGGSVGADPERVEGAAGDGHIVVDHIEHRGTSFETRRVWQQT
jgi:hypothetical protein